MGARPRPGARALALAALLVAACASSPPPGPVPLSVTPRQGGSSAPTPVEISGAGFDASVKTNYADGSGSTLQATFAASLLPWDGSPAVALGSVAFTERRTLTAVVPAGLPPGRYDVSVTDPAGRTGVLPDGYEVTSDAASAVAFQVSPVPAQRAGVPFALSLAAVDGAGRVVSGYAGSAALTDQSGTVAPASAAFALGRATVELAIAVPWSADRITARDGTLSGTSNAFDVGTGIPAQIAFVTPPSASASSCSPAFQLELRDAGGAPAAAVATVTVALESGPPGALAVYSDAACSTAAGPLVFAPGTTRASFRLHGASAGTAHLRAVPDLLPSAETAVAVSP
ncbi:MAG TPA: hypothetical protein VF841_13625 [Anaeromyxobacter sp.]